MSIKAMVQRTTLILTVVGLVIVAWSGVASACGGFFCQNDPVDQTGERIVFTANDDETITTLIEILYQGSAEDFSWILPIPEAIDADALQVPEDGQLVFDELHQMTDVRFIAPEVPQCALDIQFATDEVAEAAEAGGVEISASGEVGPFGFDVIGSADPNALIDWLRDNDYQVTPEMEPLIDIYVDQEMAFIAMRLLDGETAESIQPIEITYPGTEPTIPIQLTAVAAQPEMPIWVWLFGDHRAVPTNFGEMEIATEEITFFPFGGNDYNFLVQQRANAFENGHAFITEYAQAVEPGDFNHPWLQAQTETAPYLTRMNTYLDPAEMTADPTFGFDESLGEVSNVRDATGRTGLYACERDGDDEGILESIFGGDRGDAIDPTDGTGQVVAFTPDVAPEPEPEVDGAEVEVDNNGTENAPDSLAQVDDVDTASSSNGTLILLVAVGAVALLGLGFAAGRGRSTT